MRACAQYDKKTKNLILSFLLCVFCTEGQICFTGTGSCYHLEYV